MGTTASGKTKLAVSLARKFNGEIISADSRQVYRGLDVGSGKDLSEYKIPLPGRGVPPRRDGEGYIPYHLIDVADPKDRFSVAEYQKMAHQAIRDIISRGKLPIIAGGSGQYIQALVDDYKLSEVKPNLELRRDLENKEADELFEELKKINQKFAEALNNSDRNNKRRLIRYLEVFRCGQNKVKEISPLPACPPWAEEGQRGVGDADYDFLLIGLTLPKEILSQRIEKRLRDRLEKENMIQEVSDLHDKAGLSWERLEEFGLEYKFIARYLQEKMDYDQMFELLNRAINQFAKKQMTWFRRWEKQGKKINWLEKEENALLLLNEFLA